MTLNSIFLFLVLSLLHAPTAASNWQATTLPEHSQGKLFTLAGSNTIGAHLGPRWAQTYLQERGVEQVSVNTMDENEYRVTGVFRGKQVYIDIKAHGSSTGFRALQAAQTDIVMSSRSIKKVEAEKLSGLGDMTGVDAEHIVAIDGLAVIVHPDNPIQHLNTSQLQALFSGKIHNWKSLGGFDKQVKIYARDENSGTWDTFKALVLEGQNTLDPQAKRLESNDVLAMRVANDVGAVGFVALASINQAKPLNIGEQSQPALSPNTLNIATEDYPLSRRLYLYTPPRQTAGLEQNFIQYVLAETGQTVVEEIGFISQNPQAQTVPTAGYSGIYGDLAQQAKRLSVNFRFKPLSAELDNKSKRDIVRLAQFLKHTLSGDSRIQLIGFSTPGVSTDHANVLSKLRASAVQRELYKYNVLTEPALGLGDSRTIATQGSKNDRVEVWVIPADAQIFSNANNAEQRLTQLERSQ